MSIVNACYEVMGWLEENVCPLVTLKSRPIDRAEDQPVPANPKADAEEYDYRLVHPSVLGMYWPSSSKMLPPDVPYTHPGILVQVVSGEESAQDMRRHLHFRLHLGVWNPGEHGRDLWLPRGDGGFVRNETQDYRPDYSGWMDAWSLCDVTMRELRCSESLGRTLSVDRSQDVSFGPYSDSDGIITLYPYWLCWIDFTATEYAPAPNATLDGFL